MLGGNVIKLPGSGHRKEGADPVDGQRLVHLDGAQELLAEAMFAAAKNEALQVLQELSSSQPAQSDPEEKGGETSVDARDDAYQYAVGRLAAMHGQQAPEMN